MTETPQTRDPEAGASLLAETYERLRQLARSRMSQERGDHTLQATALVHEAWIRLSAEDQTPAGQAQFVCAMSEVMRRVLVDSARRRNAARRGAGATKEPLDPQLSPESGRDDMEILAIDEALESLAKTNSRAATLVRLRYFTGLTIEEAAATLSISVATANRDWSVARDMLAVELRPR